MRNEATFTNYEFINMELKMLKKVSNKICDKSACKKIQINCK